MCYLCLKDNPFEIKDLSNDNVDSKKYRARLIKEMIKSYETDSLCVDGKEELNKLKEEQYRLSRDI